MVFTGLAFLPGSSCVPTDDWCCSGGGTVLHVLLRGQGAPLALNPEYCLLGMSLPSLLLPGHLLSVPLGIKLKWDGEIYIIIAIKQWDLSHGDKKKAHSGKKNNSSGSSTLIHGQKTMFIRSHVSKFIHIVSKTYLFEGAKLLWDKNNYFLANTSLPLTIFLELIHTVHFLTWFFF